MRLAPTLAVSLALVTAPGLALAVGTEDFDPPEPTETTETCDAGLVWDAETETCLPPAETTNDRARLMEDVRALAYAGRYADAAALMDRLDAGDPWVLTYRGFVARKTGDLAAAEAYYRAALVADPDHLLARSYMGQGYVEAGRLEEARAELSEIRARGGRGSWPETALRRALAQGRGYGY